MSFQIGLLEILILACIFIMCFLAYREKALTALGSVFAFILAAFLYISGGIPFIAALLGFFIASNVFTRLKAKEKEILERTLYEKGGKRDHIQVMANGGAAFIMALLYFLFSDNNAGIAVFGAIAACNSDSWASEIGVLSKSKPFSIITFKPVKRGISGGVTFLGLFSSACGAAFIASIYFVFMFFSVPFMVLLLNCVLITVFGFLGSIIDSILGAAVQPAYVDSSTGKLTEKRVTGKVQNKKVKGIGLFTNDMVNFVSSLLAAVLLYAAVI